MANRPIIRTGVKGHVLLGGAVQEFGNFPTNADSECACSSLGQFLTSESGFPTDAAVVFDVQLDPWGNKAAVNLRASGYGAFNA